MWKIAGRSSTADVILWGRIRCQLTILRGDRSPGERRSIVLPGAVASRLLARACLLRLWSEYCHCIFTDTPSIYVLDAWLSSVKLLLRYLDAAESQVHITDMEQIS